MDNQQSGGVTSYIVEGNIGAGKSTFLRLLKEQLGLHIMYEPHDAWQKVGGEHNLLEAFYQQMPRWAYTFQSYAFVSRVRAEQKDAAACESPVRIIERSVWSDRYCFAKNCHESGQMNALEWKLYQEWFSWLMSNYVALPKGFIYLQADPTVCYQRLKKRNRSEEKEVPIAYLQALHDKHERWLVSKEGIAPQLADVPVLVIDANVDFEHDAVARKKVIEAVHTFVLPFAHSKQSFAAVQKNF